MTIRKLIMVCLVSVSMPLACMAEIPQQNPEQISRMNRSSKLRSEIVERYEQLRKSSELKINQQGNDITDIIKKFIPIGSSFDKAEKILAEAGFKVNARPGRKATGDRPDRFDVYASSENIIKSPAFGVGTEVFVLMRPNSPDDYSKVVSLNAKINTKAL